MPPGAPPYALFNRLGPAAKPTVFASLQAMARRIHRDRGPDALELHTQKIRFPDCTRTMTQVFARDAGERLRLIGYAWHAGRDWRALQAALDAEIPAASVGG